MSFATYPRVLVTGALSGFGFYAHREASAIAWTRNSPTPEARAAIRKDGVDLIVHVAANNARSIDVTDQTLYGYHHDNVTLTEQLLDIPHRKFVLISTCAVYPPSWTRFQEDRVIPVDEVNGIYPLTKLISECIVRERAVDPLILRVVALLGPKARKSSPIRILEEPGCKLTLAADSTTNFLLHSDLYEFIRLALEQSASGTYNVAAASNLTLRELADKLGNRVEFGQYRLEIGPIDNRKASEIYPRLREDSWQVFARYLQERQLY